MKNIIIRSNEWYDNLPEMSRLLFFLLVIVGSDLALIIFFGTVGFFIWLSIFMTWRFGAVLINWYEWYTKGAKKSKRKLGWFAKHCSGKKVKNPEQLDFDKDYFYDSEDKTSK